MKAFALLPFFSIGSPWPPLTVEIDLPSPSTPKPPQPPEPRENPRDPEREYSFWTYFIDNPRPKS